MRTKKSEKDALVRGLSGFAWMTLSIYAILTVGLWLASVLFPGSIGNVTDYTVSTSLLAAVTFGGLYAAALALRPVQPRKPVPAEMH